MSHSELCVSCLLCDVCEGVNTHRAAAFGVGGVLGTEMVQEGVMVCQCELLVM